MQGHIMYTKKRAPNLLDALTKLAAVPEVRHLI